MINKEDYTVTLRKETKETKNSSFATAFSSIMIDGFQASINSDQIESNAIQIENRSMTAIHRINAIHVYPHSQLAICPVCDILRVYVIPPHPHSAICLVCVFSTVCLLPRSPSPPQTINIK
jgi:hypothetical protein